MSKNIITSNETDNVLDGADRFAAYVRKQKIKKAAARLIFAAATTATVILAVKYIATPVPEDETED